MKTLSECTVLITGSTDGLGKATAEWFAEKDAKVLLHGRNEEKGQKTIEDIKDKTGNENLKYYNGDFSSLESVARVAEDIIAGKKHIDILINNAGIGGGPKSGNKRETSQDGFELIWAVNYLAQVLLTRKLLPLMNNDSRIINIASVGQAELDFSDLNLEKKYEGFHAYSRSKLALIMFTFDLADELDSKNVSVNAIHPATLMKTNMVSTHFGIPLSSVKKGRNALTSLAVSDGVTGEFFDGKKRTKALNQAYDTNARATLREVTEEALNEYLQ